MEYMDWLIRNASTIGNLGQAAEAFIVTVSVVMIYFQLIQQTKLTRIANNQALVEISSPFNLGLIKDQNMAALWVKGSKEYNGFDEVKKYQYESLLIWWLIFHAKYLLSEKGGFIG